MSATFTTADRLASHETDRHFVPPSVHGEFDPESLFSNDELREFAADDQQAGRRIAKILSALFLYTLLAMAVVNVWTLATLR